MEKEHKKIRHYKHIDYGEEYATAASDDTATSVPWA
jgi:hypothetical protein